MTCIKQSEVASQSIDTMGKLIFKNSMLIIPLVLIALGYLSMSESLNLMKSTLPR